MKLLLSEIELEALQYALNSKDVVRNPNSFRRGTGSHNGHAETLEAVAALVDETLSDFRDDRQQQTTRQILARLRKQLPEVQA